MFVFTRVCAQYVQCQGRITDLWEILLLHTENTCAKANNIARNIELVAIIIMDEIHVAVYHCNSSNCYKSII